MSKWISVESELPKGNKLLTIFVRSKNNDRYYTTFERNTDISKDNDPEWIVTHWFYGYDRHAMPELPQEN